MAATDLEPRDSAPDRPTTPLPIALATSSPERQQRNLARGIAETLDDSIELARRFRERHGAGRPHVGGVRAPVAATLDDSKRLAERFSERTRHDIATTLEESRQLAERWRARTAPSVARTLAESYDLARRFERGQLRPAEPYRPPLPQGRPLLPRTLDDSLAFAARRPTATTSASLADAKAAAARFGARYNVSELVKGPLLRGPDAVVEEPQGPTLRTRGGPGPGAGGTKPLLLDEPVTFKNALWTEYPVVLVKQFEYIAYVEFVDIAAGGGYVWAVSSFHDVYVLRPGSPAFERADGAPAATRVAVLSDGSPVVVTPNHRIEIGRRAGEHWIDLSLYSSLAQSPVSAIDVGAGDAQDDYSYGQIAVLAFLAFLDEVIPYARGLFPNALLGVSMTAGEAAGLRVETGSYYDAYRQVVARSDMLTVTYYVPDAAAFPLLPALLSGARFDGRARPLVLQEIGFLPDDEISQVTFCDELFAVWDERKLAIPYLGFFGLFDWYVSPHAVASCDPCTADCTIPREANKTQIAATVRYTGLIRTDGSPKPAWTTVIDQLEARQVPP